MHFWINKPAGRYYGFGGRRYPATPAPKIRPGQCRRSGEFRQMVTPIHRFHGLNTLGGIDGPSSANNYRPARLQLRSTIQSRNNSSFNSSQRTQPNNTPNNVTNVGNNQLILSNNNTTGANRGLIDLHLTEFTDIELADYRLRCGVWITFILATGFVAGAKLYFGHHGLEILVFCGLLALSVSVCLYSYFCRRARHNSHEQQIQEEHISSLSTINTAAPENVRPVPVVRPNPPPPYHIAILIPPPSSSDEAPPPSYDKIMQ